MSDEPSILSRWSARKRAAEAEATAAPPAPAPPPDRGAQDAAEAEAEALAADREANRLAAEAVNLDLLGRGSDLSVFLRDGVPDMLRRAALQKVWRSNPVYANLDMLVDHGEDYTGKATVMETFTSAWQSGRGYLKAPKDTGPGEAADGAPRTASARVPGEAEDATLSPQHDAPAGEPAAASDIPEAAAAGTQPEPPLPGPATSPGPGPHRPPARGSLRARLARGRGET